MRFRPRISILTTLLLMTILGIALVVAQLWREVGPLRADNKRLNEERGTLVLGDPNQLQAIRIPFRFAGECLASFRVYVPPNQKYKVFLQTNDVTKAGIPERKKLPSYAGILGNFQGLLHGDLDPGECLVTVKKTRRGNNSDIMLVVGSMQSAGIGLDASAMTPKDRWPTAVPEQFAVYDDGIDSTTVAARGTEPLVLKRHRIQGVSRQSLMVSYRTPEPDGPLDGYILWVERVK